MREVQLLEKLCMAFGPSGCEDAVAHILRETLTPYADAVTEDRLGTLIFLYRGSGAPHQSALVENRFMLAAHMDEPGFMIQSVDEKGYPHPTKLSVQDGKPQYLMLPRKAPYQHLVGQFPLYAKMEDGKNLEVSKRKIKEVKKFLTERK